MHLTQRCRPSGLYNDFVSLQDDFFHVQKSVQQLAAAANNNLSFPRHCISTDAQGRVQSVTKGFEHFTGFSRDEMIGRSCNVLQGKDTSQEDVREIRMAMKKRQEVCVVILNYCKDGTPFWNVLSISPIYAKDASSSITGFTSDIIGMPLPSSLRNKPKLCLEDAMALITVFSSVPRSIQNAKPKINYQNENTAAPSNFKQKHVNYSNMHSNNTKHEDPSHGRFQFIAETSLPTAKGRYRMRAYRDSVTGEEPLALIHGDVESREAVVCRVHDQCVTSEVFGSVKCDCRQQLDFALEYIKENSPGIVMYLPQEGRGIGIANKVAAYALQESGLDTVDANRALGLPDDARKYESVRDILDDLEISSVKLLTNNPRKISCLEELGVEVSERLPCICEPTSEFSLNYVQAKADRMGHMINTSDFSNTKAHGFTHQ